jgi:hypothetical protein
MAITISDLMNMSQTELDNLYKNSSVGSLPDGNSKGTAMILPGSVLSKILAPVIKLLAWKGKVFHRDQEFLLNKITLFGLHLVKAQVYRGNSWIDGGDAIILDYSKTSFVAQKIRDEIREITPGVYLGQAYWGKTRVLNFVLEF